MSYENACLVQGALWYLRYTKVYHLAAITPSALFVVKNLQEGRRRENVPSATACFASRSDAQASLVG